MSTETKAVQRRNSNAIDALNEYMDLRDELGQMERFGQDECSCNPDNFHTCDFCKHRGGLLDRSRILLEGWGDNWAVMLNEDTLPFQDWCACGHVSGQHGARYPHVCAVDNGCEKECYGFRSRLGHAAPEMLEALEGMFDSFCIDKNSEATLCMECGERIGTCESCETCIVTLKAHAAIQKAKGESL